jgi:hypothetical protein
MAVRTTAVQVKSIIDVDEADSYLNAYMDVATELVDDHCLESEYDANKLELIERYLTAHFYACNKRRTLQQGVAQAINQTFDRVQVDFYLYNTVFGQQAMSLDPDGNLAGFVNSLKDIKKPLGPDRQKVRWLGTLG